MSGHFTQQIKAFLQTMLTLNYYHLEHCNHHWLAAQTLYFPYFPELQAFALPQCTAFNAYLIAMHEFGIHFLAVAWTRHGAITFPWLTLAYELGDHYSDSYQLFT